MKLARYGYGTLAMFVAIGAATDVTAQERKVPTAALPDLPASAQPAPSRPQPEVKQQTPPQPAQQPVSPAPLPPTAPPAPVTTAVAPGPTPALSLPAPSYPTNIQPSNNGSPAPEPPMAGAVTAPGADQGSISESKQSSTRLSLEASTRIPLDIGVQARIQTPHWVRFTLGVGFTPGMYLGIVNDVVNATNPYSPLRTSVTSVYDDGWSYNARVGLRPSERAGLYLDFGYANVNLNGKLDVSDMAQSFGMPIVAVDSPSYEIRTDLDMLMFELGWEGHLGERALLGAGLGLLVPLGSETETSANFDETRVDQAAQVASEAAALLDAGMEKHAYVPTIAVRLGYDLF